MKYFVVMIDHGKRGREASVDPEVTRREIVSRIRSGEYKDISFIHLITMNDAPEDVTQELIAEADLQDAPLSPVDRQDAAFDHSRDLRKHGVV